VTDPVRATPPTVIGRVRERAQLAAATDPERPDGTVTVVVGEPGSGKTTLLDEVVARSSRRVLRTGGVEGEAVLPFAGAGDLLLPLREHVDGLPAVQREALEIALALRAGTVHSPLAACSAALGTFASAADVQPLLLVVDDFPWLDPPSQQVLLFVARRLAPERIALLLAVRDEVPAHPAIWRLPTLRLGPLTPEESRELVRALPVRTSPTVLETIVERGGGNPLAVVETARVAGPDLLAAGTSSAALPPGSALERTWTAALDALPAPTRAALAVLALSRSARRDELDPVLRDLGLGAEDLVPAERRGLVHRDADEACLRHGLLRPLVDARAPRDLRRRILEALGRHGPPHLAVWYRAEASDAPDDDLADDLAAAARDARQRSGLLAAARMWARAADFSRDPAVAGQRLLAAATDASMSGGGVLAVRWCEQALAVHDDPLFVADVQMVRVRTLAWLDPVRAAEHPLRAADAVLPHDPGRAARLYVEAVTPLGMTGRLRAMEAAAERARATGAPTPLGLATVAHTYAVRGRPGEAHAVLDELLRTAPDADPLWDAQALVTGAQAATYLERVDDAHRLFGTVTATARQIGAPLVLAWALVVRAELDWWAGRWPAAYADATEGVAWAEEVGQAGNRAFGLTFLARVEGVRGDAAACRAHSEEATRIARSLGIESLSVYAAAARGSGALAAGEPATAAAHLARARRLSEDQGLDNAVAVPFAGDLVVATVHAGDRAAAEEAVGWVAAVAERTGSAYAQAVAARGRGLLAEDPDQAEEWFAAARRAHERLAAPYERARTLLAHAEVRRRGRRPGAARPLLLEAETTFAALGADPWTARARSELAATGHRSAPGESSPLETLTPQEFQIARGVAEGLSNVEVAAALYVSRKTVEFHLTRIYRRLGVRSRTELTAEFTRRGVL
jgi:DNA-binding CsgD family transcriptional regulator/RecA/RadA recombinase